MVAKDRALLGRIAACLTLSICVLEARHAVARPAEQTSRSHRSVHVVYFNPAGREPAAGYRERLDRIMTDIQAFYREEMARNGCGPMTFPLRRDPGGRLVVHLVRGERPYSKQKGPSPQEVLSCARRALLEKGIDVKGNHCVFFQNLIWVEDGNKLTPKAPYTGSGNQIQGTAYVTDHAILDPRNFNVHDRVVVDRGSRQSWSRYNVIQIGGVAHEMGHSFGLPHNRERPHEKKTLGTALMGGGNYTYRNERASGGKARGSFLTAAHALALSTHPLFRRDDSDRQRAPECELEELSFRQEGDELLIRGRAKSALGVVGAVVYNDPLPTGVNRDYDAFSSAAKAAADGSFDLAVADLQPKEYHLSLRAYHVNGAWETFHFRYKVEARPVVPVDQLNRTFRYIQARAAFKRKDRPRMDAALARLRGKSDDLCRKAEVLNRRLRAWERLSDLGEIAAERKEVLLPDVRWRSAKVGWFEPYYDRILVGDLGHARPLESVQRRHARGIYAHAPSRYVYGLAGKWRSLRGAFGLQKGNSGSVVFVVKGDGRDLFRSQVVRDFNERPLEVDVSEVDKLELIVETTDDGATSDWGIWFGPRLVR